MNAVCEATSMLTRQANWSRRCTALITASTWAGGPAITVWCGAEYPATLTPW
ncbi:hypothetical protein C1Y40_05712 [Mycobacterium talmoniae]|uniref:Uncharacterized protein n=1 Tax=Mycobacterium talmoniae TaxID=1858794 RepID=A0A2S8BBV2_9MYCO|nr:hypothetical protein C1Y40_05712 [Mycobacterium talmoniae]